MKQYIACVSALFISACGVIDTGNVGVRTSFGTVEKDIMQPGFYLAVLSHVDEYSAKEIEVQVENLTPKAKDNLSLRDMDVTVYYQPTPAKIRDLAVKYTGQSILNEKYHFWYPSYTLIANVARNSVYEEVAKNDSLVIHTQREAMAVAIKADIQKELDKNDPTSFIITRVLIRSVLTDPTIEASIQQAVANQKRLEAMKVQVDIAKQEAEIEVAKARGIAQAQQIINSTLTPAYLQHESNEIMKRFADKGGSTTVLLPSNVQPLINIGK